MPGKVPRWKVIHCRTCGKVIRRFDRRRYHGHVPQDVILDAIRKHYKGEHPGKFRKSIRKGVEARTKKSTGKKTTRRSHHETFLEAIGMVPPRDKKGRFKKRK